MNGVLQSRQTAIDLEEHDVEWQAVSGIRAGHARREPVGPAGQQGQITRDPELDARAVRFIPKFRETVIKLSPRLVPTWPGDGE